jgi:hypothetical protein
MSNTSNNPGDEQQNSLSNQFEVPASSQIVPAPPAYPVAQGSPAMYPVAPRVTRGMYTAAAVINWVVLGIIVAATVGFGIIVAAWFIPMTILIHKGAKGPYKHTGLAVCTLLFCNIISGILMLVDDSNRPSKPVA